MTDKEIEALWDPRMRLGVYEFARAVERQALERAWEAVHAERLIDPTENHGDVVYDRAIADCEYAIRALQDAQSREPS